MGNKSDLRSEHEAIMSSADACVSQFDAVSVSTFREIEVDIVVEEVQSITAERNRPGRARV